MPAARLSGCVTTSRERFDALVHHGNQPGGAPSAACSSGASRVAASRIFGTFSSRSLSVARAVGACTASAASTRPLSRAPQPPPSRARIPRCRSRRRAREPVELGREQLRIGQRPVGHLLQREPREHRVALQRIRCAQVSPSTSTSERSTERQPRVNVLFDSAASANARRAGRARCRDHGRASRACGSRSRAFRAIRSGAAASPCNASCAGASCDSVVGAGDGRRGVDNKSACTRSVGPINLDEIYRIFPIPRNGDTNDTQLRLCRGRRGIGRLRPRQPAVRRRPPYGVPAGSRPRRPLHVDPRADRVRQDDVPPRVQLGLPHRSRSEHAQPPPVLAARPHRSAAAARSTG